MDQLAPPVKRIAGRQRDAAKRDAILDAAWAMFLDQGVDRTTVERVAARAGTSKVTVYSHFPDKPALFDAVVRRQMDRILAARLAPEPGGGDLEARLLAFGYSLMTFLLSGEAIQFDAILTSDLRQNPALARLFWEAGPERGLMLLQGILRDAAAHGEIAVDCIEEAAEDLMGLWQGMTHKRAVLKLSEAGPDLRRVERGVRLFLELFKVA